MFQDGGVEVGGDHRIVEVGCLEAVTYLSICWLCVTIGNEHNYLICVWCFLVYFCLVSQ